MKLNLKGLCRRFLKGMKKNLIFLGLLLITGAVAVHYTNKVEGPVYVEETEEEVVATPDYFFGFDKTQYRIEHDTIEKGQYMSDILLHYIDYPKIQTLLTCKKEVFDARSIRVGRPYHIVHQKDSSDRPIALIYEKDALNFAILHFADSLYAQSDSKDVEYRERVAEGSINSSLSHTLSEQGLSQALSVKMADIFAWTIDFYKLNEGDHFKVLFDERYVEDESIGIGEVKAIYFNHKEKDYKAFAFEQRGKVDYFDEEGQGMRKAFLKSPLKFGRMSSAYSGRRFHPVQKRFKAHKGTDYAAPTGTPILATGDGTVIDARFKSNNGNYVKIRHNRTYDTQYLHMSKIAVKNGQHVKQGDVIGYVGSTGLATGPHVCYRFWKNGAQVDHRKEEFPSSDPVLKENMTAFKELVKSLENKLESAKLYAAQ